MKKIVLNTTFENLTLINPNIMNFEDESIIEASGFRIQPEYELFKRLFDIIVSICFISYCFTIYVIHSNFSQSDITGTNHL